ncbi:MAG: hypothetical protein WA220_07410 [Candidatus Nitrosopolaris sp.]
MQNNSIRFDEKDDKSVCSNNHIISNGHADDRSRNRRFFFTKYSLSGLLHIIIPGKYPKTGDILR